MFNLFEKMGGLDPLELPNSLVSVDLLNMGSSEKNLLKSKVRRNSKSIDVLVHPYFREDAIASQYPFPASEKYILMRDSFIASTIETGKPLVIFEEAAKCAVLSERISAGRGIVYWVSTCEGDATPDLIKRDPNYSLFMHAKTRRRLEGNAWDTIKDVLKTVGVKHLNIGGRYMILHQPTTQHGYQILEDLRKSARGKNNAMKIFGSGLIPGACPGQLMKSMLYRGFDISLSEISSPTNTLVPTDLTKNPELMTFY